jgi:hypothetical protein
MERKTIKTLKNSENLKLQMDIPENNNKYMFLMFNIHLFFLSHFGGNQ